MMPDFHPGDIIAGRYRLVRPLGRGGMGEVWLAEMENQADRPVALKMASEHHQAYAQQLRREYDALKGLVHPHLPRVYDFGYTEGDGSLPYLVMEYLEGIELSAEVLHNLHEDIYEVIVQLCRALAFLHTHAIVHGDLKPQNIVIAQRQPLHLKLVDFGLATTEGETTGTVPSGTIPYIAPEQLRGVRPTPASDLYALGVIVFQLIANRFPFEADNEAVTLRRRLEEEAPSLLKYAPRISVSLSDIVALLLQREPAKRPQGAREVIALLNEREGRGYPYETVQSRAAYLKSSAYRPYRRFREDLSKTMQSPDVSCKVPMIVTSEPCMGLKAFLDGFANDLDESGSSVYRCLVDEWKNRDTTRDAIWVAGPYEAIPPELTSAAEAAGAKALIVGIESDSTEDGTTRFRLPHLEISDLEEMLQVIFGQHHFPEDFAWRIWQATMGYMDAVQETLSELQDRELIEVGLHGWEWYGEDVDLPVSSSLVGLWQSRFQRLDPSVRKALALLAFSPGRTLPRQVWDELSDVHDSERPNSATMLRELHWVEIERDVVLRSPVLARAIRASLSAPETREVHGLLATLPATSPEENSELAVAHLGHLLLSPSPQLTPDEALTNLRQCMKHGQARAIRDLARDAMETMAEMSPAWRSVLLILYAESTALAGSLSEAREAALKGVEVAQNANLPGVLAESRLVLASILERLGEWDETEKHLAACHSETDSLPIDREVLLLASWAWIRFRKGDIERASELAKQALGRGAGTTESLGRLRQTLGNLAYFRGDLDAATREWEAALECYEESGDARGESDVLNNLGVAAARRGNRKLAREHWEACKKLSEQTGNQARVAGLLNNLAISVFEEGDLRTAEKNYEEAQRIYRRLDARRERIEILNNLGELNFYRASYPRARAFWNEALSEAETLGDMEARIEPLTYLGKLYLSIGLESEGRQCLEQVLSVARECDSEAGQAQALCELALYHLACSDLEKAGALLDEAERFIGNETDSVLHLNLLCARFQLLIATEKHEEASRLYESATALPVAQNTFVARARLGLLALAQGRTPNDDTWLSRIADFPEFAWRAAWYQAQTSHASRNQQVMRRELERAASRLRMIAEQLAEDEREKYLQTGDAIRFQQWVRQLT